MMYDGGRAQGMLGQLFFIVLMVVGWLILIQLFVSILLGNFLDRDHVQGGSLSVSEAHAAVVPVREERRRRRWQSLVKLFRRRAVHVAPMPVSDPRINATGERVTDPDEPSASTTTGGACVNSLIGTADKLRLHGRSLGVFEHHNRFRIWCASVVCHRHFDNMILVVIFVSSVCLALDSPRNDPSGTLASVLIWFDIALTSIFSAELVLKVIARGLWVGDGAFLGSGWNMLDATIVVVSVMSLATSGSLGAVKSFRTLRVLRPLRLISRNEGLKLVVNCLFSAVPGIANVVFVFVLVFLLFAVVCVSFFKGTFSSCQGTNATYLSAEQLALLQNPVAYSALSAAQQAWGRPGGYAGTTSKSVCEWLYCVWWPVIPQSFDNVGLAFISLFASTTVRGWQQVCTRLRWPIRCCARARAVRGVERHHVRGRGCDGHRHAAAAGQSARVDVFL